MMRRKPVTILYIDADRIVRAQYDPVRQRLADLQVRPRPSSSDLPGAVELALKAGGTAGRTWVLSTDLWSHQVTVAAQNVDGLSEAETSRALGFEAESLSGVGAIDSELGFVALGAHDGLRQYWATQISATVRNQVHAALKAHRGKLAGLLHPAGIPVAVSPAVAAQPALPWSRLEIWPGLTLIVQAVGGEVTYRIGNSAGQAGGRRPSGEWSEVLALGAATPADVSPDRLIRPDSDQQLSQWLLHWAQALETGTRRIPVIGPPVQPVGRTAYVAGSLALAGALALGIYCDWRQLDGETQVATAVKTRLQQDVDELKRLRDDSVRLEKQVLARERTIHTMREEIERGEALRVAQRERWSQLLAILAGESSTDLVIQEITARESTITIRGKCLGGGAAAAMATEVEAAVQRYGWTLTPRHTTDGLSNLYEFAWELRDTEPVRDARAAAQFAEMPRN